MVSDLDGRMSFWAFNPTEYVMANMANAIYLFIGLSFKSFFDHLGYVIILRIVVLERKQILTGLHVLTLRLADITEQDETAGEPIHMGGSFLYERHYYLFGSLTVTVVKQCLAKQIIRLGAVL
jgi:hypothetical protein